MGKKKQDAKEIRDVWQPPFFPTPEERARWKKEDDHRVQRLQSTSGHKKILAYFREIVKTDFVQTKATEIRKLFEYPADGLPEKYINETYSSAWLYAQNRKNAEILNKTIREICAKYSLHYMDWKDAVRTYLFSGKIDLVINYLREYNLFTVCDIVEEKEEPFGKDFQQSDDMAFPIAVRISPYASLRDILDFVRKAYKTEILPRLEQYRDKDINIGKVRPKREPTQKRNDFIYKNRHLSRKRIALLVKERFGELLEYTHVAKIISLENKKRK